MRKNRTIYWATAIIIIVIIIIAYLFVAISRKKPAPEEVPKPKEVVKVQCEKFTLKVNKEDGRRIQELITILGNANPFGLAFKRRQLYTIGDILDQHVPPFQFLAYIFSHPQLVDGMVKIRQSKMKYDRFVEGLSKNLLKESENKCFMVTAQGFIAFLGVDEEKAMRLLNLGVKNGRIDKRSFKPLVSFLIDEKSK